MALVSCNECGKQVSDKAESCPHCGAPVIAKKKEYSKGEKCIVCGEYFGKGKICISCGAEQDDVYVLQCKFATGHLARMYKFFRVLIFEKMETCSDESAEDVAVFDVCLEIILTIMSLHSHTKKYNVFFRENDCRENHPYMTNDTYKKITSQEIDIWQMIENFDHAVDICGFNHTEEWISKIVKHLEEEDKDRYYARRYGIYRTFWIKTVGLFYVRLGYLEAWRNKDYELMKQYRKMIMSTLGFILNRMYNAIQIMENCLEEIEVKYSNII